VLNVILLVMRENYPQSTLRAKFETVGREYFVGEICENLLTQKFRRLGAAANKEQYITSMYFSKRYYSQVETCTKQTTSYIAHRFLKILYLSRGSGINL